MNVETLLASLRGGDVPPEAVQWLIVGLEGWQQGADLEAALGLCSSPLDRRDEQLRLVIQLTPGASDTAQCAFLIDCLAGDREHGSPMAAELLKKLQISALPIPRSVKHLRPFLMPIERLDRDICIQYPGDF